MMFRISEMFNLHFRPHKRPVRSKMYSNNPLLCVLRYLTPTNCNNMGYSKYTPTKTRTPNRKHKLQFTILLENYLASPTNCGTPLFIENNMWGDHWNTVFLQKTKVGNGQKNAETIPVPFFQVHSQELSFVYPGESGTRRVGAESAGRQSQIPLTHKANMFYVVLRFGV